MPAKWLTDSYGPEPPNALRLERDILAQPELLISAEIVNYGNKITEGHLIESVALPWFAILKELERDPNFLHRLDWRTLEELIAGGWSDVILTPRSGDGGRDMIATRSDWGSIRFIDQIKAYKSGHRVSAEEVRAIYGVPTRDTNASKALITTTSDFAPGVATEWPRRFRIAWS